MASALALDGSRTASVEGFSVTGATLLTTDRDFEHLPPDLLARVWIEPGTTGDLS